MATNEQNLCMGCMAQSETEGPCSICGYNQETEPENLDILQPRTRLAERYLVGKVASADCEGLFYVGYDTKTKKRVWIREYAPPNITSRNYNNFHVQPFPNSEAQYKALMSDFEDLCETVRKVSQTEKVIPVLDLVRENNTVYAIYEYIKTITLDGFLERSGGKLSWRHTKKLLMPLLHTVANVHKAGLIHRGLSTNTILLDQSGNLWLSGFMIAAARTHKSELSGQIISGFGAPEQYSLNSWQGVWTDVYALGAVIYRTITGTEPPDARDRVYGDDLLDESQVGPDLTPNIIKAINHALCVEVEDRTQSAEMLVTELLSTEGSNTAVYTTPSRRKTYDQDTQKSETDHVNKDDGVKSTMASNNRSSANRKSPNSTGRSPARKPKKEKKSRPVLSLILSMVVGMALLGGVVVWLANEYLSDLLFPGSNSSASDGLNAGSDYVNDGGDNEEVVPELVGVTATSVRENPVLKRRFELVFEEGFNDLYAEGVIYKQSPEAGTSTERVNHIMLYVSKGPETVEMPDVIDMPEDEAREVLDALEIPYDIFKVRDRSLKPGVISSSNKQPGTMVNKNKDIIILYMSDDENFDPDDLGALPIESESDKPKSSKSSGSGNEVTNPPGGVPTGVYFRGDDD